MAMTPDEFANYEQWVKWVRLSLCSSFGAQAQHRHTLWIAAQRDAISALKRAEKRKKQADWMRAKRDKERGAPPRTEYFKWKGRESCRHGHALTSQNVRQRQNSNGRIDTFCRLCDNARQAAYRIR